MKKTIKLYFLTRAAIALVLMLLTMTAQTAWAQFQFPCYVTVNIVGTGSVDITYNDGTETNIASGWEKSFTGSFTLTMRPGNGQTLQELKRTDNLYGSTSTVSTTETNGVFTYTGNDKSKITYTVVFASTSNPSYALIGSVYANAATMAFSVGGSTVTTAEAGDDVYVTLSQEPDTDWKWELTSPDVESIAPVANSNTQFHFTMPAKSVTVTAVLARAYYAIINNSVSGFVSWSSNGTGNLHGGETVTLTSGKDGYKIATLSATNRTTGQAIVLTDNHDGTWSFTMPESDVTVTATFSIIDYSITYHPNSGRMPDGYLTTYNIETPDITLPTPTRAGYVFSGWYANEALTGDAVTTIATGSYGDREYWAKWTPCYTVHFDGNGGTGTMVDQTFTIGQTQALSANTFTREDYVFSGWNTQADGLGTAYADGASVADLTITAGETVTLYAQWTGTYTVHFNANGGSGTMADQTIASGQSQALSANAFTLDGHYFAGWNTQANGLGTTYNDGQSVTDLVAANETVNLYAQWREPVTADYVDANGDAHTLTGCKEITPDHMPTSLAGNYIVSENVTYTSKVTLSGNTTIVLANGKTMSIGTEAAPLGGDYALYASGTNSLTIYGQSLDAATAGRLEVYSTWGAAVRLYEGSYAQHSGNVVVNRSGGSNNNYAINAGGSVTIDGGKLDASITSEGSFAIDARGNISISGGSVTANATGADSYGVRAKGNITLTWTRATDRITASGYQSTNGTVSLSKRFAFDDGGTVTQATTDNIGGQTLRPAALVTFNANGGSDVAAQTLFIGTTATEPTPTRTGYDLSGWTLGNADYDFATLVTEDITLTAQWTPDPAHFSQSGDEYTIHTATGWGVFCDCLNDNDTYNRFSGKTVRLGDDIGTAENPVTRMAGGSGHEFTGTFDGGGHTLTFNYANTDNNTRTAPFSYVDGATIQNLIVGGTISGTAYRAAGIIGETGNTTSHITNCVSNVDISSGRYTGGFSIGGNVEIEGCVFNGKIKGTTYSGGFIGYSYSAQVIKNSLFAPQDGSSISGGTFYYNGGGDVAPVNSYYTQALGTAQGKACHSVTAGTDVTIDAIALTGDATEYTVSGITAYSGGGLKRGDVKYYGSGDQVSLTLSNSSGDAPDGYQYGGYTASAGTLSGTENPYTLTMPDQDVTITATLQKLMTNNDITVTIEPQTWTGNELTPDIIVKDGVTELIENTDYTVTPPSSTIKDAGDYTYTITGMGSYTGETTATFTITASISVEYTITDVSCTDTRGKLDFYSDPTCSTAIAAAAEGATVYIKVTTSSDYQLSSITAQCVAPCDGADSRRSEQLPVDVTVDVETVDAENGIYQLTMPNCNVEVKATWEHVPVILAIGNGGWATYYHEDGVTYSVSDGTAYYVSSIGESVVNLTAIDGVPAGLPVLISGTAGQSVTLTETATEVEVTDNVPQFMGTATELTATDFTDFAVGRTYVLYGGKFLLVETNGGIGAHKCWLTLTAPTTARQLNISVEGATNLYPSIIAADESTQEGGWYDLQGRKLSGEPTKHGIYIFKGKKVKK